MCFSIPQATQVCAMCAERLLLHYSSIQHLLVHSALNRWMMHSDTICNCSYGLWVEYDCSHHHSPLLKIFLGLPLRPLIRTAPVIFHFLTMFVTVETNRKIMKMIRGVLQWAGNITADSSDDGYYVSPLSATVGATEHCTSKQPNVCFFLQAITLT